MDDHIGEQHLSAGGIFDKGKLWRINRSLKYLDKKRQNLKKRVADLEDDFADKVKAFKKPSSPGERRVTLKWRRDCNPLTSSER